jgi:hypothetical protein
MASRGVAESHLDRDELAPGFDRFTSVPVDVRQK